MKSEWKEVLLSDMAYFNPTERLIKGTMAKKVSMDKLQPFCRDIPSFEIEPFNGGTKFRNGDTIMARITPCLENGKTAKVSILDGDEIGFGSTEYIVFRAKEGTDPDYLYYLVCSPLIRKSAIKSMVGSSGRQRVQTSVVENLTISVPPLGEQRIIGGVLKALDDKIALNNAINNNLEQQAQALYKSWFIDFEPFGFTAPPEWQQSTLAQIAVMKTDSWSPAKSSNTEVEHYSIPAFDEQHFPVFEAASAIKSNKYILSPESVMISKLNPETKRIWRPMCISSLSVCSTEFIVYESKKNGQRDFIYSIIDSIPFLHHICSHTTGSTNSRQRATPKATLEFSFMLPPDSVIEKFCGIVTPMYDMIASNIIENQSLAKTRDSLLPRLMSGELDVSNIDL